MHRSNCHTEQAWSNVNGLFLKEIKDNGLIGVE